MTVTISVFAAVLILFLVNIIIEHLLNWWLRSFKEESDGIYVIIVWIVKTFIIGLILHNILT